MEEEQLQSTMPPPQLPKVGPSSARPPPVDADVAAECTPNTSSNAYEQRPDSGVDLSNGNTIGNPDGFNELGYGERLESDKHAYQPHPFVPKVDDDHSYDNGVHDIQTDSPSAAKDSDAMSILHDHIAEAPLSQLHGEVPGEQPVREQALEEIANLHDEPRDRDTKTAADAPSPNSESVYDDTFLQATELPGFRFGRNDLPARDTSTASPSPSTSLNGGASLGASDQHAAVVPVAPNQELPPHSDGSMNPPEPRSVPATFSPTPQPEPQGPVGPSALVNNANDVLEAAPSESAPTTMVDSAFDDGASATFSMTDTLDSSVSHYRWENGRRYHAYRDGAYWGPNDELHNDQQDIAHKAWTLSIGDRLFMAPLNGPKIQRCLDVGTGTGLWAIEFAEMFPHAQVTGTDLSPIQPVWVPPNCMFEVDDVSMEWTFRKDSFDFIHSREMFGSIADWDFFFQQCFAHIKPGGYVECLERGVKPMSDDDTVGPDHFYTLWGNTVLEMGMKWGKGFDAFEIIRERMERAGFVDVVETKMKWPIGGWAKEKHMQELGLWNAVRLDTGIEGYVMRLFTQAGGWSYAEVQAFLGNFRRCMRDPSLHAYLPGTCVYGRKPLVSERPDMYVDGGEEYT